MASDKHPFFSSEDTKLQQVLRSHDPAGTVLPQDCARLETLITNHIARKPQLGNPAEIREYFAIPPFLNGTLSWSMTLATTMAIGLTLGFIVSSMADTSAPRYVITTTMAEPWSQLMK